MNYPLIADHGLIGDLQTAALVTTDGSIDWFCAPRFDSPSIFGALLDHEKRRPLPASARVDDGYTSKQLYLPDTAILITRFMTEAGVGEVVDFMPIDQRPRGDRPPPASSGWCGACAARSDFALDIAPRFDYGREPHEMHVTERRRGLRGRPTAMTVHAGPRAGRRAARRSRVSTSDGDLHARAAAVGRPGARRWCWRRAPTGRRG